MFLNRNPIIVSYQNVMPKKLRVLVSNNIFDFKKKVNNFLLKKCYYLTWLIRIINKYKFKKDYFLHAFFCFKERVLFNILMFSCSTNKLHNTIFYQYCIKNNYFNLKYWWIFMPFWCMFLAMSMINYFYWIQTKLIFHTLTVIRGHMKANVHLFKACLFA